MIGSTAPPEQPQPTSSYPRPAGSEWLGAARSGVTAAMLPVALTMEAEALRDVKPASPASLHHGMIKVLGGPSSVQLINSASFIHLQCLSTVS